MHLYVYYVCDTTDITVDSTVHILLSIIYVL